MRSWILIIFGMILSFLVISALIYYQKIPLSPVTAPKASPSTLISPTSSPASSSLPSSQPSSMQSSPLPSDAPPDLAIDSNGLSRAKVVLQTNEGVIKFKFYAQDAPKTVNRFIELVRQGFYNNLTFHRVIPGFIIQGGDPVGNGIGGSGKKLEAELSGRHHVEGTVAMARGADLNSADSQFYISLGTFPHLDKGYTIFGQVVEGIDVAKKIKLGDKMISVTLEPN